MDFITDYFEAELPHSPYYTKMVLRFLKYYMYDAKNAGELTEEEMCGYEDDFDFEAEKDTYLKPDNKDFNDFKMMCSKAVQFCERNEYSVTDMLAISRKYIDTAKPYFKRKAELFVSIFKSILRTYYDMKGLSK